MSNWTVLVTAAVAGLACCAHGQEYTFETTSNSGLMGSADLSLSTAGTLIGDWNADTNPTGTRTKPGIFGSFGSTENVAVPVSLGFGLGGPIDTRTSASFGMNFNTGAGTVLVSNYSANFLADGPVSLPATLSLAFDSFRTRNPDALFPGVPLDLPFGELQLVTLTATQVGPAGVGTLSPVGGGTYDISVLTPVLLEASFEGLGQMFSLGSIPAVLPIQGQVTLSGLSAQLLATAEIDLANSTNPGVALPQFPLGLPTILPPGGTANLLFDLMLDEIGLSLDAVLTLEANGTLVPAPGASLLLMGGGLLCARRRR